MRAYTGRELIRLLGEHGWEVTRVQGSHHILTHPDHEETLSVPVHGSKTLTTGLTRGILKTARIAIH